MHIIEGQMAGQVRGKQARRAEKLATIPGRSESWAESVKDPKFACPLDHHYGVCAEL